MVTLPVNKCLPGCICFKMASCMTVVTKTPSGSTNDDNRGWQMRWQPFRQ